MKTIFLAEYWDALMSVERNPLRDLPLPTAHLIMQILAWMWSIIFSLALGSYIAFGITVLAHSLILAGIFVTVSVFRVARNSSLEA